MAKIKEDNGLAVSLFPMFSILVATIGVLILIMGTISVLSTGNDKTLKVSDTTKTHAKKPHHFVWDGKSLVSLEYKDTLIFEKDIKEFKQLKDAQFYLSNTILKSKYRKLILDIEKNRKAEYIVVFVRERGFESFNSFKEFVKSKGIDIGYEPLDNTSKIKI